MRKLGIAGVLAAALAFTASASAALVPWGVRPWQYRVRRGNVHQEDEDLATEEELPDRHERVRRRGGHSGERPDIPVGVVHTGERDPVSGWLAAVQCRYHDGFSLARLQQRDAHDECQRNRDLHVYGGDLAAAGQQVPTPTGTIESVTVLIDVQGTADLTKVMVNGKLQKLAPGKADFARPVQEGRLEELPQPRVQEPGSVRQVPRPR